MFKTIKDRKVSKAIHENLPVRRYRPELHGVRGLAILGVVLFHLFGQGRVSGGIDIFLTISGFLFTAMLLREVTENRGTIDLPRYFGRLFRRIFVPAAVVIVLTVGAGLVIYPFTQHGQLWSEGLASLLYFENIELIRTHLAYEAAGQDVSPFQHFWSLSVQGQFYMIMPLVALGAYWLSQRIGTSSTRVMAWMLMIVLIASLACAVYVGSYAQDEAYLMTRTRVWQFAFGGLLALFIDRIHLAVKTRLILGYIGLLSIIFVGFVFDGAQHFPGPLALWPLLGFALVLLAAPTNGTHEMELGSAPRLLSNRIFAWIGDHAYGLYLWHWPLLIFYLAIRDREAVGIRGATFVFVAALLLAMIMHRLVEKPLDQFGKLRRSNKLDWTSLSAGIAAMIVGVLVAVPNLPQTGDRIASSLEFDAVNYPGALVVTSDIDVAEATPIPALEGLKDSHPDAFFRGCQQKHGDGPGTDTIEVCNDPDKPENPTATVVLAGGSHAVHWEAPFRILGREYGWEVLVVSKPACIFKFSETSSTPMCDSWNDNFMKWTADNDVDLVITPGSRLDRADSAEKIQGGAPERWQQITEAGADLLLIRGTPRTETDIGGCLAEGGSAEECGAAVGDAVKVNPLEEMELPAGAQTIDMNEYICPSLQDGAGQDAVCPAVMGNVIVRYDGSHMPPEFTRTLAPALEIEMRDVFPDLFS